MIIYCGLRHFYIQHFQRDDSFYILTHAGQTWDFSPELKQLGFSKNTPLSTVHHFDHPIQIIEIDLNDFYPHTEEWLDFPLQYTTEVEVEYPHAWYVRLQSEKLARYFCADLADHLAEKGASAIWGGGMSKVVAKFAAHHLAHPYPEIIISPEKTADFLGRIPTHRLPLPEADTLVKLGITTLGELTHFPLQDLMSHFGSRAKVLQEIAQGKDPLPFKPRKVLEFNWEKDFTTSAEVHQPITGLQLQPYIKLAGDYLAQKLDERGKVAGRLTVSYTCGDQSETIRRELKVPTAEAKALARMVGQLLPHEPICCLKVTVQKLEPAPTTQLEIFHTKQARAELPSDLPAQVGVEIPRRELVLEMWKELVL